MPEVKPSDAEAAAEIGAPNAGRSRFFLAALLGSLVALALDTWMLAGAELSLTQDKGMLGSFFDVQGRALLDGHLDVDPAQVGFEGFRVDGRTYIYFGLVPALLRLPVLAITDQLDGQLTQLSMLLAFVVLLAAGAQLHWRIRRELRPGAPFERAEGVATFATQLALGGAIPLYLASRPVVYHEAELWGAGLTVAALAAILGVVARPTAARIAWAGLLAMLALNTRFSVGLGPILALGVVTAGFAAQLMLARRPGRGAALLASFGPRGPHQGGRRTLGLLIAAALIPLSLHAAVNIARFGSPFGIPIEKQVASRLDPNRRAALDANDGKLFGLKFVPTTLVQAARPDAVGTLRGFPFVSLPAQPAKVLGDVRFDTVQPSLSAPTSMPALCALALLGLVALARRRSLRPLLGVVVASAGGFALTLTIAFVTTRYLADLLPFLLCAALAGLQALLTVRRHRGWLLGGLGVLALAGVVINGCAGLVSQRLFYPELSEVQRAGFVRTQDDVDDLLGRRPRGIVGGSELPSPPAGTPGDLFVLDRCAGLYVHGLDSEWLPVERTPRSGLQRLRVRFPAVAGGEEALLTVGSGARRLSLTNRRGTTGTVLALRVGGRPVATSRPLRIAPTRPTDVALSIDPLYGNHRFGVWFATVRVDGRRILNVRVPYELGAGVVLGVDRGLARFSGSIERDDTPPTACRELVSGSSF